MLAQVATVKTRLGISASTEDTLLTNFVELVTGIFNRHCNRTFARSAAAGSGAVIGVLDTSSVSAFAVTFESPFYTGLTIVTVGAGTDLTVIYE